MNRPLTIIANWKMHKTSHQAQEFIQVLESQLPLDQSDVWIAAPFTALETCSKFVGSGLVIGAQSVSEHPSGAYTGEISAEMLKDLQVRFCLIGHSERRAYFHENSEQIRQKIVRCLEMGVQPILCVGETLEDKNTGKTDAVLFSQISTALERLSLQDVGKISIAYEPVWAIGSGMAASAEIVQNVHASCRSFFKTCWGAEISERLKLLYGGSVNPLTLPPIVSQKDVDGVLVGGASLDPQMFANIIKISRELKS